MPIWAGVSVDGGSIPGNSKAFLRNEAAFHGRKDGHMIEKPLQALLEVERDVFPGHEALFDGFGDLWL